MNKKKILILSGAGAVIDWGAPTTKTITDALRNDIEFKTYTDKTIGELIYEYLTGFYHKEKDSVNFETILNYVETLYQFFTSKYMNGVMKYKNASPAFFDCKDDLFTQACDFNRIYKSKYEQFVSLRTEKYLFNDYSSFWNSVYTHFISLVKEKIDSYCLSEQIKSNFLNSDFNEFIDSFQDSTIRYYSTNYDRVPAIIKENFFFEGFTEQAAGEWLFDDKKVTLDNDCNCYYNLHGSFHYEFDWGKIKLLKNNTKFIPPFFGNPDQESRVLLNSNIITGLNKSSSLLNKPFSQFYNKFFSDCYTADLIIIIGYSFSDLHLNRALENSKVKKVIIDCTELCAVYKNFPLQYSKRKEEEYQVSKFSNDNTDGWNNYHSYYGFYRKNFSDFLQNKEWNKLEVACPIQIDNLQYA